MLMLSGSRVMPFIRFRCSAAREFDGKILKILFWGHFSMKLNILRLFSIYNLRSRNQKWSQKCTFSIVCPLFKWIYPKKLPLLDKLWTMSTLSFWPIINLFYLRIVGLCNIFRFQSFEFSRILKGQIIPPFQIWGQSNKKKNNVESS